MALKKADIVEQVCIGAGGLFVRTSRKVVVGQSIVLKFPSLT